MARSDGSAAVETDIGRLSPIEVMAPRQYAMQISNATILITVNGYSVEPITLDFSAG